MKSVFEYLSDISDITEREKIANEFGKNMIKLLEIYHSMEYTHQNINTMSFVLNKQNKILLQNDGAMHKFSYCINDIYKRYVKDYKIKINKYSTSYYDVYELYKMTKGKNNVNHSSLEFLSINQHYKYDFTPLDDVFSLIYILFKCKYLDLPWSYIQCSTHEKTNEIVVDIKKYTNIKQYYLNKYKTKKALVLRCPIIRSYYTLLSNFPLQKIDYNELYDCFY